MKYSRFQEAIFSGVTDTTDNMIINAVAGSGKTTTLIEIMKRVNSKVNFLAFNKSIADELGRRCPAHVDCSTLHSAGLKVVRQRFGNVRIEANKIDIIMANYLPLEIQKSMTPDEKSARYELRSLIRNMVSKIKNILVDYTNVKALQEIADYYAIDIDLSEHYDKIIYVMEKSINDTQNIDFDDMIFMPVHHKIVTKYPYDYILVDESQDLNLTQIDLILSLVKKPNGRVICVGDPKQSIYGFRGADAQAMERIKSILNAKEYPLSVCYRCPSKHLDLIRSIVPQIEAREDAPEGILEHITEKEFVDKIIQETNPLILCRTNGYMVSFALSLLSRGYKAIIKGRDIGANLIALVKKLKAYTMEEFYENLGDWQLREISKLDNRKIPAPPSMYDLIDDKYQTLNCIADQCKSVDEIINKLTNLFTDDTTNSFTFSTVHKAKGLENDTVYILAPHLLPMSRKNQTEDEFVQEKNIKYVAYTRSKNKLVIVHPEKSGR